MTRPVQALPEALREQMPVARRWAYFDHAAVAPLPRVALAALQSVMQEVTENGDIHWPQMNAAAELARTKGAELLGATPSEIALVPNTTTGISLIAEGYPWQAGDNVVILDNEFPSNQYPWLNLASRGIECRRVSTDQGRVDLDRIAQACDGRTRIVALSWVGYISGWRTDLAAAAELVHRRGALSFVDGIQGLGVAPLDVRQTPIDFLAADGHKWLLGPEGAGLLYVRSDLLDRIRPTGIGWNSVRQGSDFSHIELSLRDDAARFEGGTKNLAAFAALGRSIELLCDLGVAAIHQQIVAVTNELVERLGTLGAQLATPREPGHESGIVSFALPAHDHAAIRRSCLEAGVVLSCRGDYLRAAPHAYCNANDLDGLIAALQRAIS